MDVWVFVPMSLCWTAGQNAFIACVRLIDTTIREIPIELRVFNSLYWLHYVALAHNGPSIHYKWWTQYFRATFTRFAQLVTYLK